MVIRHDTCTDGDWFNPIYGTKRHRYDVQDPKSVDLYYSPKIALRLVVLNSIYSSLNLLFIINGSFSQISFFAASLCGSTLVVYITNKRYIKNRMYGYSGFDSPGSEKQILLPLH